VFDCGLQWTDVMDIESRNMHRRALAIAVAGALVIAAARAPFYDAHAQQARVAACPDRLDPARVAAKDAAPAVDSERDCLDLRCCGRLRPILAPVAVKVALGGARFAAK
jgi:hypothetical protein